MSAKHKLNAACFLGALLTAGLFGGLTQSFTVFGRIPANAGALATGNYQDTITVTVTF